MHRIRMSSAFAVTVMVISALLGSCAAPSPDTLTSTVTPAPVATPARTSAPPPTLAPVTEVPDTPEAPSSPTVVQDVPYLEPLQDSVKERLLDIYIPGSNAGFSEPHPIVVFAHGYNQGKAALATVCRHLAEQGALVFTPNWPTDPNTAASWREMTESLVCAVRFARAAAPDYNGDPDNVTLVGFSMGAGVGAIVAMNGPDLDALWNGYAVEHDGPPAQAGCIDAGASAEVRAFVGIGGAYSLPERFQGEQPDLYALLTTLGGATDLKIALMHGEFDSTVPQAVSEAYKGQLIAAGFAPTLIPYDSGHTVPRELTVSTVIDITR